MLEADAGVCLGEFLRMVEHFATEAIAHLQKHDHGGADDASSNAAVHHGWRTLHGLLVLEPLLSEIMAEPAIQNDDEKVARAQRLSRAVRNALASARSQPFLQHMRDSAKVHGAEPPPSPHSGNR